MNYKVIFSIIFIFLILISATIYLIKNKQIEMFKSPSIKPKYQLSKNNIYFLLNQN